VDGYGAHRIIHPDVIKEKNRQHHDDTGHFDVLDARWSRLTRGMKRITCVIGEFTPSGHLILTGR